MTVAARVAALKREALSLKAAGDKAGALAKLRQAKELEATGGGGGGGGGGASLVGRSQVVRLCTVSK